MLFLFIYGILIIITCNYLLYKTKSIKEYSFIRKIIYITLGITTISILIFFSIPLLIIGSIIFIIGYLYKKLNSPSYLQ